MKYLLAISILLIANSVFAQKIYTRNDTIPITQDSVTIKATSHRGNIQWQKSLDTKNWSNLVGKTTDSLKVKSDIQAMYRAKITEGTCSSVYSDTARIILDTIQVRISDIITARFPLGSISTSNPKVQQISDIEFQNTFDETMDLFETTNNLSYQMKISLDSLPPNNDDIEVIINVPNDYLAKIPSNCSLSLFALTYQNGGDEVLDNFEMIASKFNASNHTISAKLPRWIFTDARRGIFETVLTVAARPISIISKSANNVAELLGECMASLIRCPLDQCNSNVISSPYDKGRLDPLGSGNTKTHLADDFKVPVGSNIYAVADGNIVLPIKTNTVPDPKSSTGYRGYGLYMIIRHTDGSSTLYAHLSEVLIFQGFVKKGDIIAKSGGAPSDYPNAGGSTGPHLHFEYVPSGNIIGSNFRIDPFPCVTSVSKASLSTLGVTNITQTSAISGANITSDGGATVTARGVCWSTSQNPTIANSKTNDGTGTGSFTSNLTGLSSGTTYYVRAYATNSVGTEYGNQQPFTTPRPIIVEPTVATNVISEITQTTAKSGGNITSDGGAPVTARGVCWSTTQSPTTDNNKTNDGTGTGSFTSNLTGLTANTTYYVRAYATNSQGTAYGNQQTLFTTYNIETGTVTDIDGNVYKTVKIGDQWWMAENLRTTKYNDGTSIPNITDGTAWSYLSTPGYCWYNNDISYKNPYGALYNWYAVNTSKLAPTGWHVPTDGEWATLINYLGGENIAGKKIKEAGIAHWLSPNSSANNETGFTAVPGGYRLDNNGNFFYIGQWSFFWSKGATTTDRASYCALTTNDIVYGIGSPNGNPIKYGFSVRCIKGDISANLPTLNTSTTNAITQTTAISGGNVTSDGGASITARGVCWSTSQYPTTANSKTNEGTGTGSFTSNLTGLIANATYYLRAYATNSVGTAYGNEVSFKTSVDVSETVTDIDGNVYHTVKIGTQIWMVENLKTTKYRNGNPIQNITDITTWQNSTNGAYCNYNNDEGNASVYGRLYNFYAVSDNRNVAPLGWHVPSYEEWITLREFLGSDIAGGKLKESGFVHWNSPNTGATNETGFTGLPGGTWQGSSGSGMGTVGYYWSSSETGTWPPAYGFVLSNSNSWLPSYARSKMSPMSIRCIKDQ